MSPQQGVTHTDLWLGLGERARLLHDCSATGQKLVRAVCQWKEIVCQASSFGLYAEPRSRGEVEHIIQSAIQYWGIL